MNAPVREIYTDTFEHSFDEKGRIAVPAEWRSENHEKRFHIMPPVMGQNCLKVYPVSFLSEKREALKGLPLNDPKRKQFENLAQRVQTTEWDKQGRMMVKLHLRRTVALLKEVVLAGSGDHFEIWDRKEWLERQKDGGSFEEILSGL